MKQNIKKYLSYLLVPFALSATSCEDWLTLYPQDRVVEENFWEDKNDLLGVRYATYKRMRDDIEKFMQWGEIRSDNCIINPQYHSDQGNRNTYIDIWDALLDSTMAMYDWGSVYTTINYCNKVLAHGDEVLEKDKQFTASEWAQIRAEMTAMRALNYFYLIRTFKDVPYVNKIVNSDEEVEAYPATNQLAILDQLIADVDNPNVAGRARNRYTNLRDTKGLITNSAIYALLGDMYLWRAALRKGRGIEGHVQDNEKAVEFCQKAIDALSEQNRLNMENSSMGSRAKWIDSDWGHGYELLANDFDNPNSPELSAYDAIFLQGNSEESIFELQFSSIDNVENKVYNSLFGNSNGTHFAVPRNSLSPIYNSEDAMRSDSRIWYSCPYQMQSSSAEPMQQMGSTSYNMKFATWTMEVEEDSEHKPYLTGWTDDLHRNFIVYRLTDVMLMQAEAYACLNKTTEMTKILEAIYRRSYRPLNGSVANIKIPAQTDPIINVMNHRQIELIGEGKRWYDLVRYAERIGGGDNPDPREEGIMNGRAGVVKMIDDFLSRAESKKKQMWKNRINNRYGLYSPIYFRELSASRGLLQQNPVWDRNK